MGIQIELIAINVVWKESEMVGSLNNDLHIVQLHWSMTMQLALEYDIVWHAVKLGSAVWQDWLPEKSLSRAILFVH